MESHYFTENEAIDKYGSQVNEPTVILDSSSIEISETAVTQD